MRGVSHRLRRSKWRLGRPHLDAHRRWTEREGVLLLLFDGRGNVGVGEASPLPGFSPDTLAEAEAALAAWASSAAWEEALDPDRTPTEALHATSQSGEPLPPSARFAAETAVLDLVGQRRGQPLWRLLQGESTLRPEPLQRVPLLAPGPLSCVLDQAARAIDAGLDIVKLKLGTGTWVDDLDVLHALRDRFGERLRLRLDANQAWSAEVVWQRLDALQGVGPDFVEEPFEGGPLSAAAADNLGPAPVPLALDESLQDPAVREQLPRLVATGPWTGVVLKPMALGGLISCMDLAERARGAGAGTVVVSHLLDGPVGQHAAAHLALALPGTSPCGLQLPDPRGIAGPDNREPRGPFAADDQPGLGSGFDTLRGVV